MQTWQRAKEGVLALNMHLRCECFHFTEAGSFIFHLLGGGSSQGPMSGLRTLMHYDRKVAMNEQEECTKICGQSSLGLQA